MTEQETGKRSSAECFQPIPVNTNRSPILFWLRCIVDLQLGSIVKQLRPALMKLSGSIIDVGAGQSPWRSWLPPSTSYQGLDVGNAHEFGMDRARSDVVYYDGRVIPFENEKFDGALCIEVLEHAEDPQLLISEIFRVLKPGGLLILSVPWSARAHHLPHDYHRFTRNRLYAILSEGGFTKININERGNDIGAIANKLTVLTIRLLRPSKVWDCFWKLPLGIICGLLSVVFIVAAHISIIFEAGSIQDPLGYFVQAVRAEH